MRTLRISLDIGNSSVKGNVLSESNVLLKQFTVPSAVTYLAQEKYLTYPEHSTLYTQVRRSNLEHTDRIVAIGKRAMELPDYQQYDVGATSYKTGHPFTAALLFGILGDLFLSNETELNILLAVSVPIVESKTLGLVRDYEKALKGDHTLRLYTEKGQRDVTLHINSAKVLNEGQAGFLGLLDTVDKEFAATMNQLYAALEETPACLSSLEDFLVVDIGEGTTDLALFRGKRFNADFSYSITRGYGTLLEAAMEHAAREGVTIESRKKLQDLLSSTSPRRQKQREQWASYVNVQRADYIREVVATVLKSYGRNSYFDAILFLGGGFTALTGYRVDEGGIKQDDPSLLLELRIALEKNHKQADLIFGIPKPYAASINSRGLMQITTAMK